MLALAERRLGTADKLAAEVSDRRDPTLVVHALSDILRARMLAIACGYGDADDLDQLRGDPAPKLADFVLGLAGNDVLRRLLEPVADDVRVRSAEAGAAVIRRHT